MASAIFHRSGRSRADRRLVQLDYVKPQATLDALVPGFAYFASWYVLGALAFAFIAMETRGRTIDEIDAELTSSVCVGAKGTAST